MLVQLRSVFLMVLIATVSVIHTSLAFGSAIKDFSHLQSIANSNYHLLNSSIVGREFHIYVALPDDYDDTEESMYPTIYVLDGGALFPLIVGYYGYLSYAKEVPNSIIVGISYGSNNFEEGNFRSTDYTAPARSRDFWGGAENFQKILETEIMPLVEGNYRSNSKQRVIFGQSIGGQFVLFTAQTEPNLFWGHIASNPALHRNLEYFTDDPECAPTGGQRSGLFVGSGQNDDPQFREPALKWMEYWSSQATPCWDLKAITLDDHNHFSAPPAAFRQGVKWIFSDRAD